MGQEKALIRELIERIEGVTQTWFELEIEGSSRKKTLVVNVSFELDANSTHHLRATCDEIERTFKTVIGEENGDAVSKLKIVNRSGASGEKASPERTPTEKPFSDRQSAGKQPGDNERRPQRAGNVGTTGAA